MGTKALSVVVATIVALSMVDVAVAINFEWWNTSWHYRVNVTINTSVYNRTDWPIEQGVNFTALGIAGAFDNNSVRVIEYNSTGAVMSEIESQFDPGENYDKSTNAYGEVVWLLNGTRPESTMLYYYVYFDSEDTDLKPAPNYNSTLVFYNFTQGGSENFGLNNSKISIIIDTERGANYTSGIYFANVSGTVIFDSSSGQDPIEYIQYYDNPNYYGYDFKNSFEVVSNGPVRIMVRQTGDEKYWETAATLTGEGTMTKTYTIYKNSQWITIEQTFTSTAGGTIVRESDRAKALAMDIDRTNIGPSPVDYTDDPATGDPYSWVSVAANSLGLGVINLNESTSQYTAATDKFEHDLGISLDSVSIDSGKSVSELAAIYFNNITSHDPVEALRNRYKDNVNITLGQLDERKTVVQAQTDYGTYNRNETINITGNVTLDTHNLSDHANATITDPAGANISVNLTESGGLFLGNYTLPTDAITGVWNLTVRVYDENDYLLNASVTTFNVTDVYVVDILILTSPALVNQTMFANVSVRTSGSDKGILGANLSCIYYNSTNATDVTNITNITEIGFGNYSINWTAPEKGNYNLTCNATRYNNSGTGNATFITIITDTTLLNMTLTTTTYNVSGVTWTSNQTFTMRFNVTNLELGYAFAVNVTLNTSGWPINITANMTDPYSCGDIAPFGSCIVDFEVTVPEQTAPGMYNITANVTWDNYNGTKNSSMDWKNITVDSNPVLEITQSSLNGTFAENSGGFLGNFTVNSTGNEDLGTVVFDCLSGTVCGELNPVFTPASLGSLAAGNWTNVSVNITVPDGFDPGNYSGTVNASYGGVWDIVLLNVTVPMSKSWSGANVSSCDRKAIPNKTGSICEFEINNTGNVDLVFTITPPTNLTSPENFTYSNVTDFTVDANTTGYRILFGYNTTNATNQTYFTVYNISAIDPEAVPGYATLTVTLEVVLGPDIQFNVTPTKLQQLDGVTINATLTDRLGDGISWVNANITRPDGSVDTVNLTNDTVVVPGGTSNWSVVYTNTTLRGTNYSVIVFSWDDGGGYGESTEENFTVYAKLVIDIYPYPLSIEQGKKGRFYIYVNDSTNVQLQNANVTVDIIANPMGPYYDWGPYSYLTDSNGYASSTPYEILDTDPTGQWDWNAIVTYYDPIGDKNITENVSGQFIVLEEGATYSVSVSTGDQYYPGDNVTIIATAYKTGDLLSGANITINITDESSSEIKVWNLTEIPGPAYKGVLELPANFTPGSYIAKATMYHTDILPDTRSGVDFFEVLPYTPQLTLEVTVGKDIYKPGDVVSIIAFVSDQNSQYLSDANVTVKITDPNGTAIDLNVTADNGTTPPRYTANYTLANNATLGPYIVFGEVTYGAAYTSDVDIFVVSESIYAQVAIGPVVYLNNSMDILITVINPLTGQGIDPDEMTLFLYSTENNTLLLWKNLTKADFTAGDPGLFNYSEVVDSNTSPGSYIALLEIKEGTYRAWGMETFRIETGLYNDVVITDITDPLTKGSDLDFTVNITNMGEFLEDDVRVSYWIDDGTVHSDFFDTAISPTGESKIFNLSFSGVNLPAGTHFLYVSVGYGGVPVGTAGRTFQITDGEGKTVSPGGGGGGGPKEVEGIPKLSIIEFYPPEVHVERGGATYLIVTAENLGGADLHDVSAHITGIPAEWFELIKGEAPVLQSGESSDILMQIKIPENVTAQTVTLTVTATSTEMSYERSIILRIFSSRHDLVYFEIESVKRTRRNSEDRAFRALKDGKNVSMAMDKLDEAQVEIRQAESLLGSSEYEKALGRLDNAREVLEHVNELLELARVEAAAPAPTETPAPRAGISTPVLIFMLLVIVALAGAVVYLTRERISSALMLRKMPRLKKPKFRKLRPEFLVKSEHLKEDTRKVERLLDTMRDQHDKGLLSDRTYNELKKRNEAKLREIHSKLRRLGV